MWINIRCSCDKSQRYFMMNDTTSTALKGGLLIHRLSVARFDLENTMKLYRQNVPQSCLSRFPLRGGPRFGNTLGSSSTPPPNRLAKALKLT